MRDKSRLPYKRVGTEYYLTHPEAFLDGAAFSSRLWEKVRVRGSDECWLWSGAKDSDKYGTFFFNRGHIKVHRLVWMITHRESIKDKFVSHMCENNDCCNPRHLYLAVKIVRPRIVRRENGMKLDRPRALDIRMLHSMGTPIKDLVEKFGVTRSTVRSVVNYKTWKYA